jgi:hypothetical protein
MWLKHVTKNIKFELNYIELVVKFGQIIYVPLMYYSHIHHNTNFTKQKLHDHGHINTLTLCNLRH